VGDSFAHANPLVAEGGEAVAGVEEGGDGVPGAMTVGRSGGAGDGPTALTAAPVHPWAPTSTPVALVGSATNPLLTISRSFSDAAGGDLAAAAALAAAGGAAGVAGAAARARGDKAQVVRDGSRRAGADADLDGRARRGGARTKTEFGQTGAADGEEAGGDEGGRQGRSRSREDADATARRMSRGRSKMQFGPVLLADESASVRSAGASGGEEAAPTPRDKLSGLSPATRAAVLSSARGGGVRPGSAGGKRLQLRSTASTGRVVAVGDA
jgi:hypothetical protein